MVLDLRLTKIGCRDDNQFFLSTPRKQPHNPLTINSITITIAIADNAMFDHSISGFLCFFNIYQLFSGYFRAFAIAQIDNDCYNALATGS